MAKPANLQKHHLQLRQAAKKSKLASDQRQIKHKNSYANA
jgi:hypothetical protein